MIPPFSDPFTISKNGGTPGQSKKEIRTGQALNLVAIGGGANALRMAVPEAKTKIDAWRGKPGKTPHIDKMEEDLKTAKKKYKAENPTAIRRAANVIGDKANKAPGAKYAKAAFKPIAKHPAAASAALGVGLVGLHGTELVGDAIANRSLRIAHKNAKK